MSKKITILLVCFIFCAGCTQLSEQNPFSNVNTLENGAKCSNRDQCLSNNCRFNICCPIEKRCCENDNNCEKSDFCGKNYYCEKKPVTMTLFPLSIGSYWEYRSNVSRGKNQHITVVNASVENGNTIYKKEHTIENQWIMSSWEGWTSQGLFSYKQKNNQGVQLFSPKKMLIKLPMTIGDSWSWEGSTDLHKEDGNVEKIDSTAEVFVEGKEKVYVKDVRYSAFKIKYVIYVNIPKGSDPTIAEDTQGQLVSYSWYVPGVGLVQMESFTIIDGEYSPAVKSNLIDFYIAHN